MVLARRREAAHLDDARRNLAHAVELALTEGRGGEAYFVADEGTRTLREFLSAMAKTQGVTLPDRSLRGGVARPLAAALEGVLARCWGSSEPRR